MVETDGLFAIIRETGSALAFVGWGFVLLGVFWGSRVFGVFQWFIDGEFDPGSGRTLAACLTHASRTVIVSIYTKLL